MISIYDNDLRCVSEQEIMYNILKKENIDEQVNLDEFINSLSPSKKNFALNVIELYRRKVSKAENYIRLMKSEDIYAAMKENLYDLNHEEFWIIYLNNGLCMIKKQRLSSGGLTATYVDLRQIFKEAFLCNATSIILCHNHPSGYIKPSIDDEIVTEKIVETAKICNIKVIDHIVFSNKEYYSFADEGKL